MKKMRLAIVGSAILSLGLLASCNSDSSVANPTSSPNAASGLPTTLKVEGLVQSVLPDSVLWSRGGASGKLGMDVSKGGNSVTIDVSSLAVAMSTGARTTATDTAWISLWTSGLLTTKVPYVYGAVDSVVPAPAKGKDTVAWNLLKVRDSLPRDSAGKVPSVAQVFAQMVLNGDARFVRATLPKGLPVDSVRIEGVRLAGSVAISSTAMKSLGLDSTRTDSLRKVLGIPSQPKVTVSDSLLKVYAPVFSIAPNSYASAKTVALSSTLPGATIRYTTDGTTPNDSSPIYSSPIVVSKTVMIQAIARRDTVRSTVSVGKYVISPATEDTSSAAIDSLDAYAPMFSLATGTYATAQTLTISTRLSGATIRYTTNGRVPNDSSPVYSGPITVSKTTVIEAIATKGTGFTSNVKKVYCIIGSAPVDSTLIPDSVLQVRAPVFSVPGGTYSTAQIITIKTSYVGGTIHYTLDGMDPTAEDPIYSGPITVSKTATFLAVVINDSQVVSAVTQSKYLIKVTPTDTTRKDTTVAKPDTTKPVVIPDSLRSAYAPVLSVAGGTYYKSQSVVLKSQLSGGVIRYTTDGTTPNFTSPIYSAAILVSKTTTLKAVATKDTSFISTVTSAAYVIKVTPTDTTRKDTTVAKPDTTKPVVIPDSLRSVYAPILSVAGGTYYKSQSVVLKSQLSGGVIRYTTDGTTPNFTSPIYSAAILVSKTTTLKAVATKDTSFISTVSSAVYVIAAIPTDSTKRDTVAKQDTSKPVPVPKDSSVAKDSLSRMVPAVPKKDDLARNLLWMSEDAAFLVPQTVGKEELVAILKG